MEIDWEMRARQMAENLQSVAAVLGAVAFFNLWSSSGWGFAGWVLVCGIAACAFDDARIEP